MLRRKVLGLTRGTDQARKALRDDIVATTSEDYFETSLALAAYEHDVSKKGLLGYAAVIAEAVS